MRRRLVVLAYLVCLILTGDFAFGATWVGNYPWGPLWNIPENWDPPAVPGPFEAAYINPPPEQGPVIDYDTVVGYIYGPRFDSDSNQSMYIFHGSVTVNGNWEFGDNGSGTSFVTLYGDPDITVAGEIRQRQGRAEVSISDSASLTVGSNLILADSGIASLDISGDPTIVIGFDLGGGKNGGSWFESYISGGDISVGGSLLIGAYGSGVIDISEGNISCGNLRLDVFSGESAAQLNISGGSVDVNDELSLCKGSGMAEMNVSGGELNVGELVMANGDGNSIINMSGGTVVVQGGLSVPELVDGNGVINLEDGLIECGSFTHGGAYLLDVNDGVLIIGGDANATILADVSAGHIRTAVDKNSVMVDYNNINPGKTTVWAAPHFESVPYVVGLDWGTAQSVLSQSGLAVGIVVQEYNDVIAADVVMEQEPNAGDVLAMGSSVNLLISLGQPIVPDVVGMSLADANSAIVAVDQLTVGLVTYDYSDTVAAGDVISQSPESGVRIPIGSSIDLVISLGMPIVPFVTGEAEADAISDVEHVYSLSATVSYAYHNEVVAGFVISQDPVGGTPVPIGSVVSLMVSLGKPVVPDLSGMTVVEAAVALEAVLLVVGSVDFSYSDSVDAGLVISQSPLSGTAVAIGSGIDLTVSLGRPTVPAVVGLELSSATIAVEGIDNLFVGDVVWDYNNVVSFGLVIRQNPVGGSSVLIGTAVELTLSLGRPFVVDVVGLSESAAVLAIESVDSLATLLSYEYHNEVAADFVIRQDPVGGTSVLIGSTVGLVVSLGQPVVPDLSGMTEVEAAVALEAVLLVVGSVDFSYSDSVDAGLVITQSPSVGTVLPIGSGIDLTVSLGRPTVPAVVGLELSSATIAVEGIDNLFVGDVVWDYNNVVSFGLVISQNPVGGSSVLIGTAVELTLSLGRPVVVDVVGLSESAAVLAIESVDSLGTILTYEYDNEIAAGDVISQVPVGDIEVDIGSNVELVVSLGRPVVPLVIDMAKSVAISAIEAVDNLEASVSYDYHDSIAADSVMAQYPIEGTVVNIGTTVNVIVSLGRAVVPDVVGQSRTDAILAIRGVGSYLAEVHYVYHESVGADIVISQDPVGGVDANIGTVVALQVSAGGVSEMVLGGYRLVELQNNDGGWDSPLSDGNSYAGSDPYGFTWAALGLSQAYLFSRQSDDPNLRAGLEKASSYLLGKEYTFTVGDGYLAVELDRVFGGTVHKDHVKRSFYDKLAAGTYADARSGESNVDTSEYVGIIRDFHSGDFENLAAWELGVGVYSARVLGVDTSEWVAGLKEEIDELNGVKLYDVLGLAGAVLGLSSVDEDYDPVSGEHAGASSLEGLASILASYQLDSGGFTWHKLCMDEGDETIKETVFGLMALNEFDRAGYLDAIGDVESYIQSVVLGSGGWENYTGVGEENRITGEALTALATALAVIGDFDGDADVDMFDFTYLGSAWMSKPGDSNWNADCDISELHDLIINSEDLGAFLDNWLVRAK